MKLSDLIKCLTDIGIEYGECDTYITTENETQLYDTALVHALVNRTGDRVFLRIEGITNKNQNGGN